MRHPLTIAIDPRSEWRSPSGKTLSEELAEQLEAWLASGMLARSRIEAERLIECGRFVGVIVNEDRIDGFRAQARPWRSYLITEPAIAWWLGTLLIDASVRQRMHQALAELVRAGHLERRTEVRTLPGAGSVGFYHVRRSIFHDESPARLRPAPIADAPPSRRLPQPSREALV